MTRAAATALLIGCLATLALGQDRPEVIDGDTVRYQGRTVRLVGFDAPETGERAGCDYERALGAMAATRLSDLIATRDVRLKLVACNCPPGTEGTHFCNYGRSCGVLTVDGRNVGDILVAEDLARPFSCRRYSCPRPASWCPRGRVPTSSGR